MAIVISSQCLPQKSSFIKNCMVQTIKASDYDYYSPNCCFFFNVGPPKEDIFPRHLLCPIFHNLHMLQITNFQMTTEEGFLSYYILVLLTSVSLLHA